MGSIGEKRLSDGVIVCDHVLADSVLGEVPYQVGGACQDGMEFRFTTKGAASKSALLRVGKLRLVSGVQKERLLPNGPVSPSLLDFM